MKQKRYHSSTLVAVTMIGTGLVMLGLLLVVYLDSGDGQETVGLDFSTIPAEVNYAAPDLRLRDMNGNAVSLDVYRGKVVLVNLWATWCPPCKAEMPTLQGFYEKYNDKGFFIIAINNGETAELVRPFVREYGLTFPVWLDEGYMTGNAFGTVGLPSSWVIDRVGTVRLSWVGEISSRVLEKYIPSIILE